MGFTVYYRSVHPLTPETIEAVERATGALCQGRTWLGCEPVHFYPDGNDGHLSGGSKPNFLPHPDDVAAAAREGLPDGTPRDLLDVLCRLSRDYGVDWEISHSHSGGPIGYIRTGVCEGDVLSHIEALADLGDFLGDRDADEGV